MERKNNWYIENVMKPKSEMLFYETQKQETDLAQFNHSQKRSEDLRDMSLKNQRLKTKDHVMLQLNERKQLEAQELSFKEKEKVQ
mmetsp:Transcript_29404/g.44460  ORF Transcript_29404/g.44460 Transcript_29404/m.44460 type:complete len:85 (+) Transcript_29404:777-1031(+)